MDISIQELIDQREKALNYEDWEKYFDKIKGYPDFGGNVKITFKEDIVDYGYVFTLPTMTIDENDFFLHIPRPDNPGGIGNPPGVHIHVLELASNDEVIKIECKPKLNIWNESKVD